MEYDLGLETALAWIFTRDSEFTRQIDLADDCALTTAFEAYRSSPKGGREAAMPTVADAWTALRLILLEKSLTLRGVSFRPPHPSIHSLQAGAFNMSGPPNVIPKEMVERLVVDETKGAVSLRTALGLASHEAWWRHNQIDKIDLQLHFPQVILERIPQRSENSIDPKLDSAAPGWEKLTRQQRDILKTYFALRKDGIKFKNVEMRNEAIREKLGGVGSPKAIYLAMTKYAEVFGTDPEV